MIDADALLAEKFKIIDISQPISSRTACFPGDVPFSREVTVNFQDSGIINLTALRMSPHVGTHADAPVHVRGTMESGDESAADLPVAPFLGMATVLDLSPLVTEITPEHFASLESAEPKPRRLILKTNNRTRFDVFEQEYAHLSLDAVRWLQEHNIVMVGLDTPSVDHTESKSLDAHHELLANKICWLENLILNDVAAGNYFLIALPLRFTELEASPVRAVLLSTEK